MLSRNLFGECTPFCLCSCLSECTRVIAPLYNSLCIYIRISSQGVGGWEPLLLCLENWAGGCNGMKLLEYSPELEDSHFAELNALDNGMEDVVDLTAGVDVNDSLRAPDSQQSLAQHAQPTLSVGFPSSWQLISDGATDSVGRNDVSDISCKEAVLPNDTPGVSAETFDALLEQAHISNLLASQNSSLPWELGVHAAIFSDSWDVVQHQNLNAIIPPELPDAEMPVAENPVVAALDKMKRKSVTSICDRVIRALPDKDFHQLRADLWNKALNKLLLVFTLACFPGELGTRVWSKFVLEQQTEMAKEILRDVLGNKSPNTVNKRSNSFLALADWLHEQGSFSWPFPIEGVLDFMNAEIHGKKSSSRGKALLGALRFFKHVMHFDQLDLIINDPQLVGRSQRLDGMKEKLRQARPLKLSEVKQMENFMIGDGTDRDKYLMGGALFALFSRSRWSDISLVESLELDACEVNGQPYGFLESSTRHQKTGTSALKKAMQTPLVSPVLGVTDVEWAHIWVEIVMSFGVDLSETPFGPICRAPQSDGKLTNRSVTSEEIGDFLNAFLQLEGDQCVSSHSLKRTTLAWASKYGLPETTRAMLGHHEVPGQSMACYSRDLLARPLAQYQSMLLNVRRGYFLPDESRSGRFVLEETGKTLAEEYSHMADTARPWPFVRKVAKVMAEEGKASPGVSMKNVPDDDSIAPTTPLFNEELELDEAQVEGGLDAVLGQPHETLSDGDDEALDSSSSSDSSESSSESVNEEELHEKLNGDSYLKNTSEPIHQHRKTKMLHRPGRAAGTLLCGRRLNDNYAFLKDGASFHWPRCTGCFRGDVLSTVDQMADAFDKVRAQRGSHVR